MPELRKDPVTSRWVIIAGQRANRSTDFPIYKMEFKPQKNKCPFCKGNESDTPPEIIAYREEGSEPNSDQWWIRVIPNKFAALDMKEDLSKSWIGVFDLMNGVGSHEVVIETPEHDLSIPDFSNNQVEKILWAYHDRVTHLAKDTRIKYILVFKNFGAMAGATIAHSHSQIIGMPIIPKLVNEELQGFANYFEYKERCIYCDIIKQELVSGTRVILENDHFVTISPFASRSPYEMWILPKRHEPDFTNSSKEEITDLADILKKTLTKLKIALDNPAYNYIIHTIPTHHVLSDYHWHIEIMPRISTIAGFEWGSGFFINHVVPEDASKKLREIKV